MRLWLLVPLLAAVLPQARHAPVEGVVANASGAPAGAVIVVNGMTDVIVSGTDGRFRITHPEASWLRFTADGYVPATRPVSSLRANE